ncbi:MAG: protein-S-isoprenylcysteine O-methyltransferase [Gemmataceae bacterium]
MAWSIWDIVFVVGFVIYIGIRGQFEKKTRGQEKVTHRGGAWDIALMVLVAIGALLLPILYLFTPLLSFADYQLPMWMPWCGTAIMLSALWLFWRSHAGLGKNWSVTLELRREHELVTHGVYRRIRHPMYAAIFLFGIAQGMLLANWLAGWSAFVCFAVMYLVRFPREERMMVDQFGDEYRAYMRRSGRIFPRIGMV